MIKHKDYPGIKRSSKRTVGVNAFAVQKAIYSIEYKCEV